MSPIPPIRPDLALHEGYHSPQVPAQVRLNTNESPFPPPAEWLKRLEAALGDVEFNRYPDRHATELRERIAELHGVTPAEVFCANGSNEALQCLLLAYGGPGRSAAMFEPTYALHAHISRLTGTDIVAGMRNEAFAIEPAELERVLRESQPTVLFFCSPNNPTGLGDPNALVEKALGLTSGLVVVDEAYGQFASWSALDLRKEAGSDHLVVVRTFSKTWSMAAARLGYLVAHPDVVAACEAVALPYHLSAQTQLAGVLALEFRDEMEARVREIATQRDRLIEELGSLPVTTWPSEANFVLVRPLRRSADEVWQGLVERSVLVRNCSSWAGLQDCLRVSVGTEAENRRLLGALKEVC